jgi:putative peptide zinc metalloprotease protein
MTPAVTAASRVRLHALHMRREGEEWIVGRVEEGSFVALPPVGVRVLELLRSCCSVEAVAQRLAAEQDAAVDVIDFVESLAELGFVADIDGITVTPAGPTPTTMGWIQPGHVWWTLHPVLWAGVVLAAVTAAGVSLSHPGQPIRASDLVWSRWGSLVMLSLTALTWVSVFLHEMAHLVTARAAGVPARMSISTRLQFLAAQTDVSGIWSAPRRIRILVYLAGMAVNTMLASAGALLASLAPPGFGRDFGAILCINQLMLLSVQFLFFMRTDIFFLIQDLARCRDLYGDATSYVWYLAGRLTRRRRAGNPLVTLPARERRVVRLYTIFLVPGTAITLLFFVLVTLPVLVQLIEAALRHLTDARSAASVADACFVLAATLSFYCLWAWAWWRRHGAWLRSSAHRLHRSRRRASAQVT